MQLEQEPLSNEQEQLNAHRRRLGILLLQQARRGGDTPPEVVIDIEEAQAAIRNLKATLRASGVAVADLPEDTAQTVTTTARLTSTERRNRDAMLQRVRTTWVTGLLERSLTEETRIPLELEKCPAAVQSQLKTQVRELIYPPIALPYGTKIIDQFDALGGELLILGAPGAGKTTILLELARDLLDRAEHDEHHPIPVVFNLSSWASRHAPLAVWLVDELNTVYYVPRQVAQAWIDDDALLLLLDGLDEVQAVHRAACVEAINTFRQDHGMVDLVVCSRVADYEALGVQLKLQGAIFIQPLTEPLIAAYLDQAGSQVAALRAPLAADAALRELAATPLMLTIMTLAYQGRSTDDLLTASSATAARRQLFAAYIERMFTRRGTNPRYPRERTMHLLVWLACRLSEQAQTVFFIERLQPAWLTAPVQRRRYAIYEKVVFGVVAGVISGLVWSLNGGLPGIMPVQDWVKDIFMGRYAGFTLPGFLMWLAAVLIATIGMGVLIGLAVPVAVGVGGAIEAAQTNARHTAARPTRIAIVIGCVVGLIDGALIGRWNGVTNLLDPGSSELVPAMLGIGLISAVGTGMGAGFTYWLAGAPGMVTLTETVGWEWPRVRRRLALVLGVGLSCGLILGLVWGLVSGDLWLGLIDGLAVDLVAGLMLGFVSGLVSKEIETKQIPNQGIWRSARTAIRVGCAAWLVVGLSIGLAVASASIITIGPRAFDSTQQLLGHVIWSVTNWGIWALSVGWGAGILYGGLACLRHLLLRLMLWRSAGMPWNYAHFLDYAAERIFLYKVGGGYIFVHRLLLEYFAALDDAPATAAPPTAL